MYTVTGSRLVIDLHTNALDLGTTPRQERSVYATVFARATDKVRPLTSILGG